MKRVILKMAVLLLRIVYIPFKCLGLKNKVTIISRQSVQPTGDILMLADYLKRQYPDMECRLLSRFIHAGIRGKLAYAPHLLTQMRHLATSKAVVLDGYCITACVLNHKPQTRIIQMWHALAAIKKFGFQTIGRSSGHSDMVAEIMCMHRNYDYVLCPSEETGRIYCEAFRTTPEKLRYLGLPRIDRIMQPQHDAAELRAVCGIPEDKKILLYAPTFRKGSAIPIRQMLPAVDPKHFAVVLRVHPLDELTVTGGEGIDDGPLQVSTGGDFETYDWMAACDGMITDYSAMAVEFALTGKPLYFYVYDIDRYEQSTGLNVDPRQELPGACAKTPAELEEILNRAYDFEALSRFRNRYISIDTNACTAQLGDYIHGIVKEVH